MNTIAKQNKTLTAYRQHLKTAHRLSDPVIERQIDAVKLIGLQHNIASN